MQSAMIERAKSLLAGGTAARVIGWKIGDFDWDLTPAVFTDQRELDGLFAFNDFSGANLSKYLVAASRKEGKTLVFLKPCDTYSFSQLIAEHRIRRESVYAIGVPCSGMVDPDLVVSAGADGAEGATAMSCDGATITVSTLYGEKKVPKAEALEERCRTCRGKNHVACDEVLAVEDSGFHAATPDSSAASSARFDMVAKIESMTSEERFDFWRGELSRCIRCNACRNACPACTCEKCVFDNDASGVASKSAAVPFEENMFHIIRAFHVAGRCTDCGACSRACPQNIPLHLLNRKFIKDIDCLYSEYQAGSDPDAASPLGRYDIHDAEPSIVHKREGGIN